MKKYIVTFHSEFGALSYCKALKKRGINVKPQPVPRKISSSCGICACYEHDTFIEMDGYEMDRVYQEVDNRLEPVL